jgi:sigma-E factor negative regulatory protein RseC
VDNVLHASTGERVVIGIPSGALWKSAFRLYGLPLLMLIAGGLAGQHAHGDLGAVAGAAGGMLLAVLVQKSRLGSHAWQPVMLRRADEVSFIAKSC